MMFWKYSKHKVKHNENAYVLHYVFQNTQNVLPMKRFCLPAISANKSSPTLTIYFRKTTCFGLIGQYNTLWLLVISIGR